VIAAEIRAARGKLGLTQGQLAAVMGVRGPTISEWETGKRSPSDTSTRLLRAYLDGYRPIDWPACSAPALIEHRDGR
jgi:transcriptional regulator with XRE-family HTH domain